MAFPAAIALAAGVLAVGLAATPLAAQAMRTLHGRVTDTLGAPLEGVSVTVERTLRSTATAGNGTFSLRLGAGPTRLVLKKIGYEPAVADIGADISELRDSVQVILRAAPVELLGLTVAVPAGEGGVQTVTPATVRQVPPLGEPDIFRAVVLLPGVSQPNDLKGRIHLAGGASDETGVLLDGHPLQDPFHLLGLLGAFNVAALERADVRSHYLPAAASDRLSGLIELETRHPGPGVRRELVTSLLSSSATITTPTARGAPDLLASGRLTYLDRILAIVAPDEPRYAFLDGLVRVGAPLTGGWRAEVLGFITRDVVRDAELADVPSYQPLSWGEALGGVRLSRPDRDWAVEGRASWNRAWSRLDERGGGRSNFVDNQRDWTSATLAVRRRAARWSAIAGAFWDRQVHRNAWEARGLADEIFSPNTPSVYKGEEQLTRAGAFIEGRVLLGLRWLAEGGVRAVQADRRWHWAPSGRISLQAGPMALELAAGRRLQFDAELEEPIEGSITPPRFLLDRPRVVDAAAVVADWKPGRMLGGEGSVRVAAFAKRYHDRTVLPPLANRDTTPVGFPAFERTTGSSVGSSIGVRVARGPDQALQASYTLQRVREVIDGTRTPTAWDVPHEITVFASTPVLGSWTFSVAYHAHSGRATTPISARIFAPGEDVITDRLRWRFLPGERNSVRVAPYHRLDLGLRRTWGVRGEWTLSLQVLNLLFRSNPIDYDWEQYFSSLASGDGTAGWRSGLPILPSIGLEVRW